MDNLNELEIRNDDLKILVEVTKALNESSSLHEIYKIVLEKASRIDKVDIIMIYLVDERREVAVLQAHKNVPDSYLERAAVIPYPKGFTWKVINSGVIHNIDDHSKEKSLGKAGRDLGTKGVLAVPIKQSRKTIGVIHFISYKKSKYNNRELDVLSTLGDQISIAISKAKQSEEIRNKDLDLEFSRIQHKDLFENVPAGICRTDPDGEILIANNTFVELLGYSSIDQLLRHNNNIKEFSVNDDDYTVNHFNTKEVKNSERTWRRKDNTLINVIHNSHPVKDENGSIFYIENVIQDITVQKNTEKALNTTITELIKKNKYENIISSITKSLSESIELGVVMENTADLIQRNVDGVDYLSIYLVGNDTAVLKASRGYPENFIDEIKTIQRPDGQTWESINAQKVIISKNAGKVNAVKEPLPSSGNGCFISIPVFSSDKVTGCINISSVNKQKFDDDEVSLLKVISRQIGISITNANYIQSLRNSGRALLQSEEKFRNTFENAAVGIALVDMAGNLTRVNEKFCNITGYKRNELVKTGLQRLTYPKDIDNDLIKLEKLNRGDINTYSVEKRYLHKRGYPVWVKLTVSLQKDTEGKPFYYIVVIEDISERKKYEMQLMESIAEKEVLIKEIHHRVKNNLQIISSLIHLQSRKLGDDESAIFREMYDRIRIMALTHEQLYQSENLALINFENFIRSLIDNLIYSYKVNSDRIRIINNTKGISFGINIAIPCGLIVNELLTNSIKYAFTGKEKGTITIDLRSLSDQVANDPGHGSADVGSTEKQEFYKIRVSDNGNGLPEDFDIHETNTLGMQIVLDLVDQINGKINVFNNTGSTFEIIFPEN